MLIWLKAFLLIGASISFALGITLPLMRFESFYVFSTDASLIEVVVSLWDGGDGALAAVVALVSIVFPFAKILLVAAEEVAGSQPARPDALARLLPALSKWSMMDVLLVETGRRGAPCRFRMGSGKIGLLCRASRHLIDQWRYC